MPLSNTAIKKAQSNYKKITKLFPFIEDMKLGEGKKLSADGFMDLSINLLDKTDKYTEISLTHYYEQNGDLVPDPDMAIRIFDSGMVLPVHFQNSMYYQQAIDGDMICKKYVTDQNNFLGTWLKNIEWQGHSLN